MGMGRLTQQCLCVPVRVSSRAPAPALRRTVQVPDWTDEPLTHFVPSSLTTDGAKDPFLGQILFRLLNLLLVPSVFFLLHSILVRTLLS